MPELLIALATAVGVVASCITIIQGRQLWQDRARLTWRSVDRAMRKVLAEMNAMDYEPDIVVGVGRGGAIVGGMLAGNLGHVPLFVVDTILDRSKKLGSADVRFPDLCPLVKGLSVLIAVGELYSGEDLRTVAEYVEARDPAEIRTMTLFSHPATSIRTDFLGRQTKRPLEAPWRLTEAYRMKRL